MEDLEEGELSNDSDPEDTTYTPLERPANYSEAQQTARFQPIVPDSESEEEEDESSDSDSDSFVPIKKTKVKRLKQKIKPIQRQPAKKKKNDIWSSRLKDDVLSESLNNCDVGTMDKSRSVESYDYSLAWKLNSSNKRTRDQRDSQAFRQRRRSRSQEDKESAPRNIMELSASATDDDQTVAKDIANKLLEEKEELVAKVIETMGRQRAIEIFNRTREIEADGGMLIVNQSRRRTPGGVFFYLVRTDYHITPDQRNAIFGEERQAFRDKMKEKKKKKIAKLKLDMAASREKMLPELLTKTELLAAQSNRLRKETDGAEDVINPPPTPETDGHENSGDGMDTMKPITINPSSSMRDAGSAYDVDFLDISCANDMDLF